VTNIYVKIGVVDVSDAVEEIEVWRKQGQIRIILRNDGDVYTGIIPADALIEIKLDGVPLIYGYVDSVNPKVSEKSYDHYEQKLIVSGRDVSQDLMNKVYDKIYCDKIDNIIADLLQAAGTEISYTSQGIGPVRFFDCKAMTVYDAVREILELSDWEGFVDSAQGRDANNKWKWKMFSLGGSDQPSSGITLKAVPNDPTNNILEVIDFVEKDAYELRNYIIAFGTDKVDDAWTELTASYWQPGKTGNTISDVFNPPEMPPTRGGYAIKVSKGTATDPEYGHTVAAKLTFPNFNYDYLDFSKVSSMNISFRICAKDTPGIVNERYVVVYLKDINGNRIAYKVPKCLHDYDFGMLPTSISIPVGKDVKIYTSPFDPQDAFRSAAEWHLISGTSFSWDRVVEIMIEPGRRNAGSFKEFQWMLIDNLIIPNFRIREVAQDLTSQQNYKVRKLIIYKRDISYQQELKDYAESILRKRKNPFTRLQVKARGDVGLIGGEWRWLPGYKVTVNIPGMIENQTYRFVEIHHIIKREGIQGFDHVVELSLVPYDTPLDTLRWSYVVKPQVGYLRELHERLRVKEQEAIDFRDWYEALPKPYWELYGRVPWDGMYASVPSDNLLWNPNFELDFDDDGVPDGWTAEKSGSATYGRAEDYKKEGKYSIYIDTQTDGWAKWTSHLIPVMSGCAYFLKTNAIRTVAGDGTASIGIDWLDENQNLIASENIFSGTIGTSWEEKIGTLIAPTSPSPAYYAKVFLKLQHNTSRTKVYFDSVFLTKVLVHSDRLNVEVPPPPSGFTSDSIQAAVVVQPDGTTLSYFIVTIPRVEHSALSAYVLRYRKQGTSGWNSTLVPQPASGNPVVTTAPVESDQTYEFQVCSVNKLGKASDWTSTVTKVAGKDTTPPATPTGLTASAGVRKIILTWNPNSEIDLKEYLVYRNTVNNSGTATLIARVRTTRFEIDSEIGTTYYFWIKAVDYSGNTSGFSSVASAAAVAENITNVTDSVPSIPTISVVAEEVDTATEFRTWLTVTITRVDGAGGYVVAYRKYGETNWNKIYVEQPASGNPIVRTPDLPADTTYEVMACSVSPKGTASSWTNVVQINTKPNNVAPDPPEDVSAIEAIDALFLTCSEVSATDFSHYEWYVGTTSPPTTPAGKSTKPYFYWKASNYNAYYVGVKAVDTAGNPSSMTVSSGTYTPAKAKPIDLSIESRPWTSNIKIFEDCISRGKFYYGSLGSVESWKRYVRTDTTTVGSNTYNNFGLVNSDTSSFVQGVTESDRYYTVYFGIRIFKVASDGTETEITSGSPVAVVFRDTNGSGIRIADYSFPGATLATTDRLCIKYYIDSGGGWEEKLKVVTDSLGVTSLPAGTWRVSYYTYRNTAAVGDYLYTIGRIYFGADYDTSILTVQNGSIKFADGTTKTINGDFTGTKLLSIAVGAHFVYWQDADSDLHITTNYAAAVGEGKGLIAAIDRKTDNPSTILMFDSYTPTIGAGCIAAKSILADHIKAGQINTTHITSDANLAIKASQILLDGTTYFVSSWQKSGDVTKIDGGKISAGTVTADQIAAGAITADKIAVGAVTADKISAGAVTSEKIAAGQVTTDHIRFNVLNSDPTYEAGKMWYRGDLDELRFASGTTYDKVAQIPKISLGAPLRGLFWIRDNWSLPYCEASETDTIPSGNVTWAYHVRLDTGSSVGGYAKVWHPWQWKATWSKRRILSFFIKASLLSYVRIRIWSGTYFMSSAYPSFGVYIDNNTSTTNPYLVGFSWNGTSSTSVNLMQLSANTPYLITIEFIPGQGIYFYVDGVLKGSITSNLPSDTANADVAATFEIYTYNTTNHSLWVGEVACFQEL